MNTPENITELKNYEVMVVGTNRLGHHSGGAAKQAYEEFGLLWGKGEGFIGKTYAFPTLDEKMRQVTWESLTKSTQKLYHIANLNPKTTFYLTKVGCGIAGFEEMEMA